MSVRDLAWKCETCGARHWYCEDHLTGESFEIGRLDPDRRTYYGDLWLRCIKCGMTSDDMIRRRLRARTAHGDVAELSQLKKYQDLASNCLLLRDYGLRQVLPALERLREQALAIGEHTTDTIIRLTVSGAWVLAGAAAIPLAIADPVLGAVVAGVAFALGFAKGAFRKWEGNVSQINDVIVKVRAFILKVELGVRAAAIMIDVMGPDLEFLRYVSKETRAQIAALRRLLRDGTALAPSVT